MKECINGVFRLHYYTIPPLFWILSMVFQNEGFLIMFIDNTFR